MSKKNQNKKEEKNKEAGQEDLNFNPDQEAKDQDNDGQAYDNNEEKVSATDVQLSKALFLLKEAQKGIAIMMAGEGPFEDKVSGLYFRGNLTQRTEFFNLSLWDKGVQELMGEINAKS